MSTVGKPPKLTPELKKSIAWVREQEKVLKATVEKRAKEPYRPYSDRELDDLGMEASFAMAVAGERKRLEAYGFVV